MLYGSESELDDSDEEGEAPQRSAITGKQRKGGDYAARLRVDDDEPMDLLAGAASRITSKYFFVSFSVLAFHLPQVLVVILISPRYVHRCPISSETETRSRRRAL